MRVVKPWAIIAVFGLFLSPRMGQAQIVYPGGTEDFESMTLGADVTAIPDWIVVNTSVPLSNFTVVAANDVLGVVTPRGASTQWLRVDDVDAADVQNRFYSGALQAPMALDYKWTFFINLETIPPGGTDVKPKLTIQHFGAGFANAWGIEFTDIGANLIVLANGGTPGSVPLYALGPGTGVGDWVKLELIVHFDTNTVSASANDGPLASLPINLIDDPKIFRFCYRGEGTGNIVRMLVDDVSVETASACCLPDATCAVLLREDCLAAGGSFAPPDEFCQGDTDGDGADDRCDGCPDDPAKTDPGICGCGVSDADSDGDGLVDCQDPCPDDGGDNDSDGDGVCVPDDACPSDPNKTAPGACGCGVEDADVDLDGTPDCAEIPAVSTWGLLVLALTLLAAAKIRYRSAAA